MSDTNKNKEERADLDTGRWIEIDAKDKVLGRLACDVSQILLGKDQVDSKRHEVEKVNVVVINTDQVFLTGSKEEQKFYRHYTGYPGGLKERNVAEQRKRDSRVIVENAVSGMLPKNKLRSRRMANMKLIAGSDHPFKEQVSK